MKTNNSQVGSAKVVLVSIFVVMLVSAIGFITYQNLAKSKLVDTKFSGDTSAPSSESTSLEGAQTSKEKIDPTVSLDVNSIGVTLSYPTKWAVLMEYSNGVTIKSSDLAMPNSNNYANISAGSLASISATATKLTNASDDDLLNLAKSNANGYPTTMAYTNINGFRVIEFSHSSGENRNNHSVAKFIKNGKEYTLDQEYNLNSDNPYPTLINTILNSLIF